MNTIVEENHIQVSAAKLVDAPGLLDALFDEASRPSLRWLRQMQAQRKIPYVKIGHLVRFDVEKVRSALEQNCTVNPKARQMRQPRRPSWGDSKNR